MDEEVFEKKSSKKTLKIIIIILLLVAIVGAVSAALVINNINAKPEKVFSKALEGAFDSIEETKDVKSERMELEISGGIKATKNADSEMASQMGMINLMLKTASLKLVSEIDIENQIFNYEATAKYMGKDVISLEYFMQDEKIYCNLKDLYDKYIEIPMADIKELTGYDLKTISMEETLLEDIEDILKAKIDSSDIKAEEVEIDIDGTKKKVNKSSLTLSAEEAADVLTDILNKVNENVKDEDIQDSIAEVIEELKEVEANENIIIIDIFTEKLGNKAVRYDIKIVDNENEELMLIRSTKMKKDECEILVLLNENSTNEDEAVKILSIKNIKEDKNKGKLEITIYNEEEGLEITLNIAYKYEYNVNVSKKNVNDTIRYDELTEEDGEEILNNLKENEILGSIVNLMEMNMNNYSSDYDYSDYDFDDEDYDFDDEDYNYDFDGRFNNM